MAVTTSSQWHLGLSYRFSHSAIWLYVASFAAIPLLPQNQTSTPLLLVLFGIQSLSAGMVLFGTSDTHVATSRYKLEVAFWVPRLLLLFMLPWLSDDVYRYLWDGLVAANGINPFAATPQELTLLSNAFPTLYEHTAYKDVYTTYPPLSQLLFMVPGYVILLTKSWFAGLMVFKLMLVAAEYIALKCFRDIGSHAAWYVLCPLPVVELAGQGHLDGFLLLPIALFFLSLKRTWSPKQFVGVVVSLSSLALLKVYPAIAALTLLRNARWTLQRTTLVWTISALVSAACVYAYLHNDVIASGVVESLQAYSLTLQFNAVPMYMIKNVLAVFGIEAYWEIAPFIVNVLRLCGVIAVAMVFRSRTMSQVARTVLALLLVTILLSSKVHVWYFVPLLFVNTKLRYSWVWGMCCLSMFTYAAYTGKEFQEQYALQYALWVLVASWAVVELRFYRTRDKQS